MKDEIVDVVDKNDKVIGKERKSKCHKKSIWHRISAVLLFNSEGKVWLQTRSKEKAPQGRSLDFSASGHIGYGKNYEEEAKREMKEELGIDVELKKSSIKIFEDYIYDKNHKIKHVIKLYIGKSDGPFKIQEGELDEIKAYSLDKIKELMERNPPIMTEGLRLALKEFFKK